MMKTPPPTVWFMWFTSLAWCLPVVAVVGTAITKDRGYHLAGSKAQQGQQGQQSHQLGHVEKDHLVQDINTTVTKKGHTPSADEKYVLITVGDVYPEPSNFRPEIVMYALQGAYATARSWYYYGFSCPACPKRDTDIVVAPELPSLTPDDILDQIAMMVCTSLRASGVPAFRDASMCTIQELDDA